MQCPKFTAGRRRMMSEITKAIRESKDYFKWNKMSTYQKWKFLLGDGPPVHETPAANRQWGKIETSLYHFLAIEYKERRKFMQSLSE